MSHGPFIVEELPKAGFLARLAGRAPREAAFVEVRNLLAKTPWHDVSPADLATVLAKYKLLPADAEKELTDIFARAAAHIVVDGRATDVEKAGLSRLREAFEFSEARARAIFNDAARGLYRETLVAALADGEVTPDERQKLDRISVDLGLSQEDSERLYREEALRAVQLFFDHVTADKRFSPDEEERLTQIGAALGVKITHDASTLAMLERFRLFGRIEVGALPTVTPAILLQRGEVCHFLANNIAHKEMRTVTKRVNYSGVSASIKIVKGVRYRIGSIAPQRVTQDVLTVVDSGSLHLTNKRVLVQGTRKNTSVNLTKVIHFTVYSDGLQIQKETGKDLYLTGEADWEVAGACLDFAARSVR